MQTTTRSTLHAQALIHVTHPASHGAHSPTVSQGVEITRIQPQTATRGLNYWQGIMTGMGLSEYQMLTQGQKRRVRGNLVKVSNFECHAADETSRPHPVQSNLRKTWLACTSALHGLAITRLQHRVLHMPWRTRHCVWNKVEKKKKMQPGIKRTTPHLRLISR